jgi:hypothetical protein
VPEWQRSLNRHSKPLRWDVYRAAAKLSPLGTIEAPDEAAGCWGAERSIKRRGTVHKNQK